MTEVLTGQSEVLVPAKHLVNGSSIRQCNWDVVDYFHVLFDSHEIIMANGAWSESFHPGEQGFGALSEDSREEILEIFPELGDGEFDKYGPSARYTPRKGEALLISQTLS